MLGSLSTGWPLHGWLGARAGRRRVLAFTGAVMLGSYTVVHVVGLLSMVWGGPAAFNATLPVRSNVLLLLWVCLWCGAPLLLHSALGVALLLRKKRSLSPAPSRMRALTWLWRLAGLGVLVFVVLHVAWVRVIPAWDGRTMDAHSLQTHLKPFLMVDFYVAGMMAVSLHWGAGMCNALVHAGVTVSAKAQRVSCMVCAVAACALCALGLWVVAAFHDGRFVLP